jgi:hypothetical protein
MVQRSTIPDQKVVMGVFVQSIQASGSDSN